MHAAKKKSCMFILNHLLHIKPGNLLLATDGTLKISDFGVAEVHKLCEIVFLLTVNIYCFGRIHVNLFYDQDLVNNYFDQLPCFTWLC